MRSLTSILFMVFFAQLFAQTSVHNEQYEAAYQEIVDMLEGRSEYNFKRAVFVTENAFLDGTLDYGIFSNEITLLAQHCQQAANIYDQYFLYSFSDREDILLNAMIFKLWSDTIEVVGTDGSLESFYPFTYDFEDPFGHKKWSRTFVSKLLNTGKGNCHSMPYLYKMIAEEMGQAAYLALAPNHIYIKHHAQQMGMYNTELTSAAFPIDAWLMASGYIHLDAIRSGIYMDTLTDAQTLSMCLFDLAKGYERKFGLVKEGFVAKCNESALKYYPNNINALLLKSDLLKKAFDVYMARYSAAQPSEVMQIPAAKEAFEEYEQLIVHIHQLGYRKMPERMYNDWLLLLQQKREEYTDTRMNEILNN